MNIDGLGRTAAAAAADPTKRGPFRSDQGRGEKIFTIINHCDLQQHGDPLKLMPHAYAFHDSLNTTSEPYSVDHKQPGTTTAVDERAKSEQGGGEDFFTTINHGDLQQHGDPLKLAPHEYAFHDSPNTTLEPYSMDHKQPGATTVVDESADTGTGTALSKDNNLGRHTFDFAGIEHNSPQKRHSRNQIHETASGVSFQGTLSAKEVSSPRNYEIGRDRQGDDNDSNISDGEAFTSTATMEADASQRSVHGMDTFDLGSPPLFQGLSSVKGHDGDEVHDDFQFTSTLPHFTTPIHETINTAMINRNVQRNLSRDLGMMSVNLPSERERTDCEYQEEEKDQTQAHVNQHHASNCYHETVTNINYNTRGRSRQWWEASSIEETDDGCYHQQRHLYHPMDDYEIMSDISNKNEDDDDCDDEVAFYSTHILSLDLEISGEGDQSETEGGISRPPSAAASNIVIDLTLDLEDEMEQDQKNTELHQEKDKLNEKLLFETRSKHDNRTDRKRRKPRRNRVYEAVEAAVLVRATETQTVAANPHFLPGGKLRLTRYERVVYVRPWPGSQVEDETDTDTDVGEGVAQEHDDQEEHILYPRPLLKVMTRKAKRPKQGTPFRIKD
jgi:hypothetical protein